MDSGDKYCLSGDKEEGQVALSFPYFGMGTRKQGTQPETAPLHPTWNSIIMQLQLPVQPVRR